MRAPHAVLLCLLAAGVALSAPQPAPPPDGDHRCEHHRVERQAFYGDLHVHTALSLDASTQQTRTRPDEAYAFATGAPLDVQPFDQDGNGSRTLRLARPLDFAAVTDHAELIGEVETCNDPALPGYRSIGCRLFRNRPRVAFFTMNSRMNFGRPIPLCGPGRRDCLEAARRPWQEIQQAAARWNKDSGDCSFTTFVGYEWTGARGGGSIHRNVIFSGASVPELPADFYAAPSAELLWEQLGEQCVAPDCDFIVIPHNSNLSDGQMFRPPADSVAAAQRAEAERLVEIMQHKGASECWPGSADELCGFEPLPYSSFIEKYTFKQRVPGPDAGWVRAVLQAGISLDAQLGVNPYVFGLIGSSDTHLGAPGLVSEASFPGHGGAGKPGGEEPVASFPDEIEFNPGGLAGVWAEENTRESIFAALHRRETFATSGPRMQIRMFAAAVEADACLRPELAARADAVGHPMGAVVSSPAQARFVVEAHADPHSQPLQRLQIIKGWLEDGVLRESVVDLAAAESATVDPDTCAVSGEGPRRLCVVWDDPDHDPSQGAVYYARALEAPSCRWSQQLCVDQDVDCDDPPDGMAACCAPAHQATIQERAWSSPIWFRP